MVRSGVSQSAVARLMGVSSMSVSKWCRASGVHIGKARAIPPDVKATAVARVREGMTRAHAARLAGATTGMVSKWCSAAGIPAAILREGLPTGCVEQGMKTFSRGDKVTMGGETYEVMAVGATDPEAGTYLHIKHLTKGWRTKKKRFYPNQACGWSIKDGIALAGEK